MGARAETRARKRGWARRRNGHMRPVWARKQHTSSRALWADGARAVGQNGRSKHASKTGAQAERA
eukprot:8755453-Alexandrium_andersonii.AAC.1